jgi:Domain of unknown function (DUF4160)
MNGIDFVADTNIILYTLEGHPGIEALLHYSFAVFSIETGNRIKGEIPGKQERLIQAWVEIHRTDLEENFRLLSEDQASFFKIDPLS